MAKPIESLNIFSEELISKAAASMSKIEGKAKLFSHPVLKLFTQFQLLRLQKNYSTTNYNMMHRVKLIDFKPVVKLFTPHDCCTWLLTELDPHLFSFGLCDLGFGKPEIGYLCLKEVYSFRVSKVLLVERAKGFKADKTLSEYARLVKKEGRIFTGTVIYGLILDNFSLFVNIITP